MGLTDKHQLLHYLLQHPPSINSDRLQVEFADLRRRHPLAVGVEELKLARRFLRSLVVSPIDEAPSDARDRAINRCKT